MASLPSVGRACFLVGEVDGGRLMLPGVRSGFWSKSTFKPGLALKSESLGGRLGSVDFPTGGLLILPGERKGL